MSLSISQLVTYPLKSAAGIPLTSLTLDHRGPLFDRAWMVVDSNNRFLTQRTVPTMCLIETRLNDGALVLGAPNMSELNVPAITIDDAAFNDGTLTEVVVWNDTVSAADCGDEAAAWLSSYLKRDCRLVFMPEQSKRLVDLDYAKQQETVGFADGFPILLASEASLLRFNADLEKLGSKTKINMQRFRPNIVVSGCQAYAEDGWRKIQINNIVLSLLKPCSRCIMPAIDQGSGVKQMEIIEVLNNTRRRDNKTYFGQNALHDRPGHMQLGEPVTVID